MGNMVFQGSVDRGGQQRAEQGIEVVMASRHSPDLHWDEPNEADDDTSGRAALDRQAPGLAHSSQLPATRRQQQVLTTCRVGLWSYGTGE